MKGTIRKIKTGYKSKITVCRRCGNPVNMHQRKCPFCKERLKYTDDFVFVQKI